jgi:hypothetical protein
VLDKRKKHIRGTRKKKPVGHFNCHLFFGEYKVISLLLKILLFDNDDDDDGFNEIIISYCCEYIFLSLDRHLFEKTFLSIK